MRIEGIAEPWPSPAILAKLDSKHALTPDEVEEALFDPAREVRTGRQGCLEVYSRTEGGRYLLVVVAPRTADLVYVVTARDMTVPERRLYTKKRSSR